MSRPASKVSREKKRGYVLHEAAGVYVRGGFGLARCVGEAHSNPNIDYCMACMSGTWGWRLTKPAADQKAVQA